VEIPWLQGAEKSGFGTGLDRGRRHCDSWWENETEWHRNWKGRFPVDWQEIVHHAEDGERHIADVKTDDEWVIEFQHSYIRPEERRFRESFYPKLVWVIDGLRRKTDVPGFQGALEQGTQIVANFPALKLRSKKGALLRDWAGSRAHVFFDFGDIRRHLPALPMLRPETASTGWRLV